MSNFGPGDFWHDLPVRVTFGTFGTPAFEEVECRIETGCQFRYLKQDKKAKTCHWWQFEDADPTVGQQVATGTILQRCGARCRWTEQAVLKKPDCFFWLKTAQGPPTTNRKPPTAKPHQPLTTNRCQPPPTTNRQPPTAKPHQPPTTNRCQPPPTTNRQPLRQRRSYDQEAERVPVKFHFCWQYEGLFFPPEGQPCPRARGSCGERHKEWQVPSNRHRLSVGGPNSPTANRQPPPTVNHCSTPFLWFCVVPLS